MLQGKEAQANSLCYKKKRRLTVFYATKMQHTSPVGTLYLVSTPIGNLEDITLRALRILKAVDLIAAEDTRQTRRLLTHYDIHTPLTSYFEGNAHSKSNKLIERLQTGETIALVSRCWHAYHFRPRVSALAWVYRRRHPDCTDSGGICSRDGGIRFRSPAPQFHL